eukprot:CAMPEP_0175088314 /NCGR_PEP_ID=MMETSP0086_2-20121207/187_1 /TAXON_ID=136419 /ORGANISM="Unknown Unknown, Strain D1" /LENGTH=228 /DNA_ID=CAMNT_0016360749 /DNA_START=161 /DNA_END=844 /DNA_ORIENTATION=+
MVLMGLTKVSSEEIGILGSVYAIPWVFHLGFAFGLPLLFQLVHQKGWCSGTIDWAQNLLLGSVYYLFQLRTKAFGVQQALRGGSAQYQGTGRSLCLKQNTLLTLYKTYAQSHYHHAIELLLVLTLYVVLLADEPATSIILKTYAILLAIWSWLLSPALFNPTLCENSRFDTLVQEKLQQLHCVRKWVRGHYTSSEDSWHRWWWTQRFVSLRRVVVRFNMETVRADSGW